MKDQKSKSFLEALPELNEIAKRLGVELKNKLPEVLEEYNRITKTEK